jgi:hypothetical protein
MTLPATLPDAIALLGNLLSDGNLWLGLGTVAVVLVVSGVAAWAVVRIGSRR